MIEIRRADDMDLPAIVELWQELMDVHAALDPIFRTSTEGRERYARWVAFHLLEPDSLVLLAEAEGHIVGYGLAYAQVSPDGLPTREGLISDVCITKDWRNRGIGRRLARALEDGFAALGVERIEVKTSAFNPQSNHFWCEVMGYKEFLRVHHKTLS